MTTPNDKLPEEITKEIQSQSEHHATVEWGDQAKFPPGDVIHVNRGNSIEDYTAGATAWAPWKVKYNEAKKLLDEVLRKHESGLLPDRFIYEKIKTFLNGE